METIHNPVGHEQTDVGVKPIARTGLALATMVGVVLLVVLGIFHYFVSTEPMARVNPMAVRQIPSGPVIQDHPTVELEQLRKQEDQILNTYGWVDKASGRVRIPIDRAIELELQKASK